MTFDYIVVAGGGAGGSGVIIVQYPGGTARGTFNPAVPVTTLNPGSFVRHTIAGSTNWTL